MARMGGVKHLGNRNSSPIRYIDHPPVWLQGIQKSGNRLWAHSGSSLDFGSLRQTETAARRRTLPRSGPAAGEDTRDLPAGRVQIGVLPHLNLHLFPLFLEIHQRPAVTKMAAFHLALGTSK